MPRNNWSRDELIVAFNLYCTIPFTKINAHYPKVIELASLIGRSPSSVALKLANFARLDPTLKERNISGMTHGSQAEIQIWNEFIKSWEQLSFESEVILARYSGRTVEKLIETEQESSFPEGRERETYVKNRVNQSFFRRAILASYNNHCCITGLSIPDLLVAGHIIPWAKDTSNRMNPRNGICMNALHDKAFDKGLMTITPDYKICFSEMLLSQKNLISEIFFVPYQSKTILLPQRFLPDKRFLDYHNAVIFKK